MGGHKKKKKSCRMMEVPEKRRGGKGKKFKSKLYGLGEPQGI